MFVEPAVTSFEGSVFKLYSNFIQLTEYLLDSLYNSEKNKIVISRYKPWSSAAGVEIAVLRFIPSQSQGFILNFLGF